MSSLVPWQVAKHLSARERLFLERTRAVDLLRSYGYDSIECPDGTVKTFSQIIAETAQLQEA